LYNDSRSFEREGGEDLVVVSVAVEVFKIVSEKKSNFLCF